VEWLIGENKPSVSMRQTIALANLPREHRQNDCDDRNDPSVKDLCLSHSEDV
jgi:hypothetical protein